MQRRSHGRADTPPVPEGGGAFSAATRAWFDGAFAGATAAQAGAWDAIATGQDVLVVAPTGSGKTLAAFLWSLDRLASTPPPVDRALRCRVLYISPLKALAVDVERNLRAPLTGHRAGGPAAGRRGAADHRRRAHRRHPGGRAPPARPHSPGRPHHDARVALPDPHLVRPRGPARCGDGHRRRGARGRRHQAGSPPGAHPGAPRRPPRATGPADRPVGDRPPGGRGRALPRRIGRPGPGGPAALRQADRAQRRRPGRGPRRAAGASWRRGGLPGTPRCGRMSRSASPTWSWRTGRPSCSPTPGGWPSGSAPGSTRSPGSAPRARRARSQGHRHR